MLDARQLHCEVCGCKKGTFRVEGEELLLDYACKHESAELVMNLGFIGYEDTESDN